MAKYVQNVSPQPGFPLNEDAFRQEVVPLPALAAAMGSSAAALAGYTADQLTELQTDLHRAIELASARQMRVAGEYAQLVKWHDAQRPSISAFGKRKVADLDPDLNAGPLPKRRASSTASAQNMKDITVSPSKAAGSTEVSSLNPVVASSTTSAELQRLPALVTRSTAHPLRRAEQPGATLQTSAFDAGLPSSSASQTTAPFWLDVDAFFREVTAPDVIFLQALSRQLDAPEELSLISNPAVARPLRRSAAVTADLGSNTRNGAAAAVSDARVFGTYTERLFAALLPDSLPLVSRKYINVHEYGARSRDQSNIAALEEPLMETLINLGIVDAAVREPAQSEILVEVDRIKSELRAVADRCTALTAKISAQKQRPPSDIGRLSFDVVAPSLLVEVEATLESLYRRCAVYWRTDSQLPPALEQLVRATLDKRRTALLQSS